MIGSYMHWIEEAHDMRFERDRALDEVDRLKAALAAETKRSEDWIGIAEDHCERRGNAESLLEQATVLLARWCTAFSMGPLADIYLRQESKTFVVCNYSKHFHNEPRKQRVVASGDGITITAIEVTPEERAALNTGGAKLP
jgi:hypothetical protein